MALASTGQEDFSAGIHRGRKAPANAVYDAVNFLIGDDGLLFRRGGNEYYTSSDASVSFVGVTAPYLPAVKAVRVVAWGTGARVVSAGAAVATTITSPNDRRPVVVGDTLIFGHATVASQVSTYGGALNGAI
jgi:hypothetical protein